jgi:hypothetical protein
MTELKLEKATLPSLRARKQRNRCLVRLRHASKHNLKARSNEITSTTGCVQWNLKPRLCVLVPLFELSCKHFPSVETKSVSANGYTAHVICALRWKQALLVTYSVAPDCPIVMWLVMHTSDRQNCSVIHDYFNT